MSRRALPRPGRTASPASPCQSLSLLCTCCRLSPNVCKVAARLVAVWNTPWIASGSQRLTSAGVSGARSYLLLPDRPDSLGRFVLVGDIANHRVGYVRPQPADLHLVVTVPGLPVRRQCAQRLLGRPDPTRRGVD